MEPWTDHELREIDGADEMQIAGRREDDTLHDFVVIWQVRVGDEIFVRSVNGPDAAWYRGARKRDLGRVKAGSVTKDVAFTRDDTHDDEIDSAYTRKYGASDAVNSIISPLAKSTTLRVDPA